MDIRKQNNDPWWMYATVATMSSHVVDSIRLLSLHRSYVYLLVLYQAHLSPPLPKDWLMCKLACRTETNHYVSSQFFSLPPLGISKCLLNKELFPRKSSLGWLVLLPPYNLLRLQFAMRRNRGSYQIHTQYSLQNKEMWQHAGLSV